MITADNNCTDSQMFMLHFLKVRNALTFHSKSLWNCFSIAKLFFDIFWFSSGNATISTACDCIERCFQVLGVATPSTLWSTSRIFCNLRADREKEIKECDVSPAKERVHNGRSKYPREGKRSNSVWQLWRKNPDFFQKTFTVLKTNNNVRYFIFTHLSVKNNRPINFPYLITMLSVIAQNQNVVGSQ